MRNILTLICVFALYSSASMADWKLYEETYVKGSISGSIIKDTIIKMKSGSIYQVYERIRMRVRDLSTQQMISK